ncbi:MAG: hypothetical protein IJJ74_09340 [Eubacterium sp.]|nr:hypothetical protein [Eubacterium sp.]
MPYLSKVQKKYIIAFSILILATAAINIMTWDIPFFRDIASIFYAFILMGWGITVGRRITHIRMRRLLNFEVTMMAMLFVARICKYTVFWGVPAVFRASYYIYIDIELTVASGALILALLIGTAGNDKPSKVVWAVFITNVILMIFVSTNELHWKLYRFKNYHEGLYETEYGWLYYVAAIMGIAQLLGATIVITRKCSISAVRKYWYIPLVPQLLGFALILIYYFSGGAPMLFGIKMYNFQEVFCLTVAAMLETGIKIGMIPSCSGYAGMFRRSHINAAIVDKNGEYRYHSLNYGSEYDTEYVRINEKQISGGKVIWTENLETISSLNEILADTVDIIESENTLIEKENAAKEERSRYETMNSLYNSIADFSSSRLRTIDEELSKDQDDEEAFKKHLARSLVLGSYIKRRSNLTIIAAEGKGICLDELLLSINESMTYIRLCDINCRLNTTGKDIREKVLPAEEVIGLYDKFQEFVEGVLDRTRNIMVNIRENGKTLFKVSADTEDDIISISAEIPDGQEVAQ